MSSAGKFGVWNTLGPGAERIGFMEDIRLELSSDLSDWIYMKKKKLNQKRHYCLG